MSATQESFATGYEAVIKEVAERVLKVAVVERLYLLALTTAAHCTQGVFATASDTRTEITHCHLLAIVKEEGASLHRLQDIIENNLQHFLPVTAIVLSAARFSQWLVEGQRFAVWVCKGSMLLYETEPMLLPLPCTVSVEGPTNEDAMLFQTAQIKAREFIAGAGLYTLRRQYSLAAFMLHQAAEQMLSAMVTLNTGLRLHTHNLDRLLRCCALFRRDVCLFFPRVHETDKRLFQLLQKAYVYSRYAKDYRVGRKEAAVLTERAKQLQEVFERQAKPVAA